eukprot:3586491-Rhodomonas_salina.1
MRHEERRPVPRIPMEERSALDSDGSVRRPDARVRVRRLLRIAELLSTRARRGRVAFLGHHPGVFRLHAPARDRLCEGH